MKGKAYLVFFMVVVCAGMAKAQVSPVRVTFTEAINPNGSGTVVVSYTGLEKPGLQLFEVLIPASGDNCFDNYNFANARVADPDVASLIYDTANGVYRLRWNVPRGNRDSCRALVARDGTVDAADYVIWRKSFVAAGFVETDPSEAKTSDGNWRSLPRTASYSMVVDPRPVN